MRNQALDDKKLRRPGSIYTPPEFARFLTSWAIQNPENKVLDIGVGEGIFTFCAFRQLIELGAGATDAQYQIYGTEIDRNAYDNFLRLAKDIDANFTNVQHADFFEVNIPQVDAVVGNPPYIRRVHIENLDRVRQKISEKDPSINQLDLSRLTDLYVYFLLHASSALKPGGRLAAITADSWLNVGYGTALKEYLLKYFQIEQLISFDRSVFEAEVKAVILLATKKDSIKSNHSISFIRVKNGLSIDTIQQTMEAERKKNPDIQIKKINSDNLTSSHPWSSYFKAPTIYEKIASHKLMTTFERLAETRIGLQTLAKEFFVLTPQQARLTQIESEFLQPLAQSSRFYNIPTIEEGSESAHYIFYCSRSKEEIRGTNALKYILEGEKTQVPVRGKGAMVIGYHNKERIRVARRKHWYDLQTDLERRGRASILIPRLVYRSFVIVWNKAEFVPGELFIEFLPLAEIEIDIEVYLAILTSSVTETLLRAQAQVYGGGAYNINPGPIKKAPILNAALLTYQQQKKLKQAYLKYLSDKNHDRSPIDKAVYEIFGFNDATQKKVNEALEDLILIATSS